MLSLWRHPEVLYEALADIPVLGWVDILRCQQLGLHGKTGVYEKICGKFSPVCPK